MENIKSKNQLAQGVSNSIRSRYEDEDEDSSEWNDANDEFLNSVNIVEDLVKENCDNLALHEAIYSGDIPKTFMILIDECLSKSLVNKKDKHGNTPLHLACMLGRPKEVVAALLKRGASVECKNLNRWTPFHEAQSYGNREIIRLMTLQLGNNFHHSLNQDKLAKQLAKTRNYRVVLKWEFKSWVPFLNRVLPSDHCVINKQGGNIRIDTRILELGSEMMSWKRVDGCLIYSNSLEKKWAILNNKTKKFQFLSLDGGLGRHIEFKVDDFMSTDIIDIEIDSSDLRVNRSTTGWFWKSDKLEKISNYDSALYEIDHIYMVTRKRREHLSEEDLKRNKQMSKSAMDFLKSGKQQPSKPNEADLSEEYDEEDEEEENTNSNQQPTHRRSLPPPPPTKITWREYCSFEPGKVPSLGREQKIKVNRTPFKADIAVSENFPLTKSEFIDLISIIPLKLFKKLREFIEIRLPEGFPIRLEVPILPFISAQVTFEDFKYHDGPIDSDLFNIPADYEEEIQPLLPIFHRRAKESNE